MKLKQRSYINKDSISKQIKAMGYSDDIVGVLSTQ
jgi:hypothetical protein